MDILVICRDALRSKEINKEKLDLTFKFGYISLSASSSIFLIASLLPICMSTKSNQSDWWIDRPEQRCQSPAWVFRRKIENINVYTF